MFLVFGVLWKLVKVNKFIIIGKSPDKMLVQKCLKLYKAQLYTENRWHLNNENLIKKAYLRVSYLRIQSKLLLTKIYVKSYVFLVNAVWYLI